MSTHPGTAAEPADSNICICCKRSKSGGSFFEGVSTKYGFEYGSWGADIDVFREASRQGCRRCAVAFDMVTTWKQENPRNGWRYIHVRNERPSYSMVAKVRVCLSSSRTVWGSRPESPDIALGLLSANHRKPDGLVENFRNQWNIVTKPLSYEDPTSDDDLHECNKYLRQCLDYHAYCTDTLSKLPKRVLELSSTIMTLRDTASSSPKERYACLSHCWSPKGPSLQLTSATETHLRQGVDIDSLPRTFSETAKVCMKLGIRFLWIDALCIIQGDKNDWAEAAATMADIYENAFITIAATCAAGSDDGLRPFRDRFKALKLGSSDFYVREAIEDRSRLYHSNTDKFWPLLSRAWAFQEGQLAPRTLRYSCHGVIWDCRTTRAEEAAQGRDIDDVTIDLLPFFTEFSSRSDPKWAWHNTIQEYSRLDLTYRTDTLPAIAALAQRMARFRRRDTYLAGMWRNSLLSDIQWGTKGNYPRQESSLPTWSWATKREVWYDDDQNTLHSVEILGLDYTRDGPAEIGAIKDAILTIRGPTLPLAVQASDKIHGVEFSILQHAAFYSKLRFYLWPDHKSSPGFYLDGSQSLLALIISSDEEDAGGLVLRQVGTVYERVGWFDLFPQHEEMEVGESLVEHIAQLPLTTVRII